MGLFRREQLGDGVAVGPGWGGGPHQRPSPAVGGDGAVALRRLPPSRRGCESGEEPAETHPARVLQNNPHCGMGMGSGTGMATFLPPLASTAPAMLQPWHPVLEDASPPKALLPRGAPWVLAAPWAGLGTLCAQLSPGRAKRKPSARASSRAVGWPG